MSTLNAILIGLMIGYIFITFIRVLIWLFVAVVLFFIEWREDYLFLKRRNNHRVKCGLPKLKNI